MKTIAELELAAARARVNVLRMVRAGGSGHLGGAMSSIDIVTAVYLHAMNLDPADLHSAQRDRFLLSAGHKAMAQYAVLAEAGIVSHDVLDTYGSYESQVPGHPNMHVLPGVEANTGALGHGLPLACGMAKGMRLQHLDSKVFVVMGDGELPEGSNWEGAALAAHHGLDNLVVFVDCNGLQISGATADVMNMESVAAKFEAFGWRATSIDGNSMAQVVHALDQMPLSAGAPSVVVARTDKAKGVSQLEGTVASHYWKPTADEMEDAWQEACARVAMLEEKL